MNYRRCSYHDTWLILRAEGGLSMWTCPVPGCRYAKSTKYSRRLKKSAPTARFLGLQDKIRQRDHVQRKPVNLRDVHTHEAREPEVPRHALGAMRRLRSGAPTKTSDGQSG
jgi:hypothetical protein